MTTPRNRQLTGRALVLLSAAAAVAAVISAARIYRHELSLPSGSQPAAKDSDIVSLELGGRHSTARQLMNPGYVQDALHWDFLLIAGYGAALIIGAGLACWLVRSSSSRWMRFGFFAALVTVVADCAENLLLLRAVSGSELLLGINCFDAAAVVAVVKFCALIPAAATAAVGITVAVQRSLNFGGSEVFGATEVSRSLPLLATDPADHVPPAGRDDEGPQARWRRGYAVPECAHAGATAHGAEITGIGLSGGGVRAASVALGVLQSERMRTVVIPRAQYLVSVSGGGYTAGAFALALTDAVASPVAPGRAGHGAVPAVEVVRDPATALLVGSPEEDHVRRHSSYIADTPKQLLTALGWLAGHLLLTLTLVFAPAVLLGVLVGVFYRQVPITEFPQSLSHAPQRNAGPAVPSLREAAGWALALTGGLTLLSYLAAHLATAHSTRAGSLRRTMSACAHVLFRLTAVLVIVVLVLPGIIWLASWLLHRTQGTLDVASPIAGVLLTYVASLASLAWHRRAMLTKNYNAGGRSAAAPRGLVQIGLAIAAIVVLVLGWLIVFGGMATVGLRGPLSRGTGLTLLGLLAATVLLGVLTDETTRSLHPFYRLRVASAFAVRRVRRADGQIVAEPYPTTERTTLSRYGALAQPRAFPHIIFAASATLGEHRTPPGRDRVSYTFCADWVGGPDVGYVNTRRLEELAPPRLRRDLTVQGAVALSGAAIAASVGGQGSAWYEPLFVVSGVRLGAWMPNPAYLIEHHRTPRTLTEPGLPRTRRMNYLLQELFGMHPADGPLLQVTDGGFYDNLGLVELFRRGCTRIYCVDASGDSPPAATTLAQALTRAYQELGVRSDLDVDTWKTATIGSGEKLVPADSLAALSNRMSSTGIITGTFSYPESGPFAGRTGTLVVAKASLWAGLPYSLMAYAQGAATFPHDSTADQWFDDRQYAAYTELGRHLGEAAVTAMETATRPAPPAPGGIAYRVDDGFVPPAAGATSRFKKASTGAGRAGGSAAGPRAAMAIPDGHHRHHRRKK